MTFPAQQASQDFGKAYDSLERICRLGLSRRIVAEGGDYVLDLIVKPDADLDGRFLAYDMDEGDFITVNGWLFVIEPRD